MGFRGTPVVVCCLCSRNEKEAVSHFHLVYTLTRGAAMQRLRRLKPVHPRPCLCAFFPVSQQCEDLEDGASLAHMYVIVKTAIMLNDASLLEEMLKEVRTEGGKGLD